MNADGGTGLERQSVKENTPLHPEQFPQSITEFFISCNPRLGGCQAKDEFCCINQD